MYCWAWPEHEALWLKWRQDRGQKVEVKTEAEAEAKMSTSRPLSNTNTHKKRKRKSSRARSVLEYFVAKCKNTTYSYNNHYRHQTRKFTFWRHLYSLRLMHSLDSAQHHAQTQLATKFKLCTSTTVHWCLRYTVSKNDPTLKRQCLEHNKLCAIVVTHGRRKEQKLL